MRDRVMRSFAILLLVTLSPNLLLAQTRLTNLEIFNRCYMMLLKAPVPRTTSLGKRISDEIIAGRVTGSQACGILVDQVEFLDKGQKIGPVHPDYPRFTEAENQQIISTFHNFHNSWFARKSLNFGNAGTSFATQVVKDNDEPALYFTRALFNNSMGVNTVFTTNKTIRGLRVTPDKMATSRWESKSGPVANQSMYDSSRGFMLSYGISTRTLESRYLEDHQLTAFGKLIGIEEPAELIVPFVTITVPTLSASAFSTTQKLTKARTDIGNAIATARTNVNLFEHLGGGILGSQIFIIKNTNLTQPQIAPGPNNDKDDLIARRMSSRIFEDLLCHQLPTLTEADVLNEVIPNSKHGFRTTASCMACHTSIDPMAYTFRNFAGYRTGANFPVRNTDAGRALAAKGTPVYGITRIPAMSNSEVFTLQAPTGALNYRDHTNKLHKIPVSGLAQLGQALANSDDFYRCVAQRYYHFLTGYDVKLARRNIPEGQDTPAVQFHRNKVYELAANLKSHKKLKTLIKQIFQTESFTYRNYELP